MLSPEEFNRLRESLEKSLHAKIKARRIRAIFVNSALHWQPPMWVRVGEYGEHLEKEAPAEKVIAILESISFLVCTETRGTEESPPYFFAREDVRRVVEE
jgi:hypothetical protein